MESLTSSLSARLLTWKLFTSSTTAYILLHITYYYILLEDSLKMTSIVWWKLFWNVPFIFFKRILAARVFVWFLGKRENMNHHMPWIQGMVCGSLDVTGSHNLQWADRRLCWSGSDRFGGTVALSGWTLRFPMLGCCQCLNWLCIACKR